MVNEVRGKSLTRMPRMIGSLTTLMPRSLARMSWIAHLEAASPGFPGSFTWMFRIPLPDSPDLSSGSTHPDCPDLSPGLPGSLTRIARISPHLDAVSAQHALPHLDPLTRIARISPPDFPGLSPGLPGSLLTWMPYPRSTRCLIWIEMSSQLSAHSCSLRHCRMRFPHAQLRNPFGDQF